MFLTCYTQIHFCFELRPDAFGNHAIGKAFLAKRNEIQQQEIEDELCSVVAVSERTR